ncbi:YfcE family phosphodiesterase [Bacillus massiliigorillae]|uniref:YfcE family phosphodiesterase n=1 Tax=Bacillus massiliigorillae TaxID=1243664 RepID=UPI0003A485CA|nr:metallophosphoesterase [Bacillus massiliigorillae]
MKILVVSDSHGQTKDLLMLKEKYENETVAMFHCGDSELNSNDPALKNFIYVKGNCDYGQDFVTEQVKDVAGFCFFITHGHLYNIKMTLQNLSYKAEEVQANIVLFGHSHSAGSMLGTDGVLYINPGSILLPRGRVEKTYVILEIEGKQVKVNFYDHEHNLLKKLSTTYQMS